MLNLRRIMTAVATLALVVSITQCGSDSGTDSGPKTVSVTTNCFMFEAGKETSDPLGENCDFILEPWCNGRPGLCGNWVQTTETNLDAVTTPPATGYISDLAGYADCQEVDGGKVIVFKLKNGNYAKGIFTGVSKDGNDCVTGATIKFVYPM